MSFNADWTLIPEHMRSGLKAYVEDGVRPGGFLMKLLENDFIGATNRADRINLRNLDGYASFFLNYMPRSSYGSVKAVSEWIKRGGLNGGVTFNLGPLKEFHDQIDDPYLRMILLRMAEIDGDITKSLYGDDQGEDRPPNGDDYNLLFDAVIDEIKAAIDAKKDGLIEPNGVLAQSCNKGSM